MRVHIPIGNIVGCCTKLCSLNCSSLSIKHTKSLKPPFTWYMLGEMPSLP